MGPGSICPICCRIGHDQLGKYEKRPGPHKLEEHKCGVKSYETGFGKIYLYVIAVCANYKGAHQAILDKCTAKQRVEKEVRRKKIYKSNKNINDILMMQPDIDKKNARLQLKMEKRSLSL